MAKISARFLLIIICLFVLSSCGLKSGGGNNVNRLATFEESIQNQDFPSWFFCPSSQNEIGSIGIARKVSSEKRALYFSRKYALEGLFSFFEKEIPLESNDYLKVLNGEKKYIKVGAFKFLISDSFETRDYIVSRAVCGFKSKEDEPSSIKCSNFLGSFESKNISGFVGVSYRAASPQRQYELAIENGLLLLRYSYGIDVDGVEIFERLKTGTGVVRFRKNKISLKFLGDKEKIRVYVKKIKYMGDNLYVWLGSLDLPGLAPCNYWVNTDLSEGAVGVSGRTASGFLSHQIERAFKNGVLNLAKNDDVLIEGVDLIEKSKKMSFFNQWVKSSYKGRVFPRLKGFYLDEKNRVYVWVVSVKD